MEFNVSTKELCREFSHPKQKSYLRLKRLVRYLVGLPRLVHRFDFIGKDEKPADAIDLYVDTDFAGCRETRRSTSGGVATLSINKGLKINPGKINPCGRVKSYAQN